MPKRIINEKTLPTLALINFIFAVFVDSIFIFKDFKTRSIETLIYLVVFNLGFLVFSFLSFTKWKRNGKPRKSVKSIFIKYLPVTIIAVIVAVLAVLNYDTTAIYDAHLYYGSFLVGLDLFENTVKTAIGALIQWGHNFTGTALFVAPFECLAYGKMVGSYFANTLLFCFTLYVLYALLLDIFKGANKWMIVLGVAVFAFMPYSFSLITYFCPDFYLPLYTIWLLYAYKKDNQLLVSFIGMVICLTKDSGAFFYGFLVLFLYLVDANTKYKKLEWLKPKNLPIARFILWLIPAGLYVVNYFLWPKLVMQQWDGAGSLTFGINSYDIFLQSLIDFAYGYRWLILVIFAVAVIVKLCARKTPEADKIIKLDKDNKNIIIALSLASIMLHLMFSVFTLSHCPRYSSPMNVILALLLVYSICVIFASSKTKQIVSSFLMAGLMLVQSYFTIDPVIKNLCTGIDMGENTVYNLGVIRNVNAGFFNDCIGDYHVYNTEYKAANELGKKAIKMLDLKEDTTIYVYNTYHYEYHINGIQYQIYWDTKKERQTYTPNKNTIYINSATLENQSIYPGMGDKIIVFVPSRKDFLSLDIRMSEINYFTTESVQVSTLYGTMILAVYEPAND